MQTLLICDCHFLREDKINIKFFMKFMLFKRSFYIFLHNRYSVGFVKSGGENKIKNAFSVMSYK